MILELEAAIGSGRLVDPKGNSAWDIYQQLSQQPATAADAARFKTRLTEALVKAGKEMVTGLALGDSISDRTDDFKRAGQMFLRARTLAPENSEAAMLEKLSAAAALIALQFYDEAEKAISLLPKSEITENALGLIFSGRLDYWKAERAFRNALELKADWAAPHYNLGLLFRAQKKAEALAEFEQAANLDTKTVGLFMALGDEYFSLSKWQPAAEAYRKAVALKPNDDTLHTKLGHALYSQGLRDEANREYQKAKELRSKQ
jgi:Flp pilus assembly protein TadD